MKKVLIIFTFIISIAYSNSTSSAFIMLNQSLNNSSIEKEMEKNTEEKLNQLEQEMREKISNDLENVNKSLEDNAKSFSSKKTELKEDLTKNYKKISKYLKTGQIIINSILVLITLFIFNKKYKEYKKMKDKK